MNDQPIPTFDPSNFNTKPYVKRVKKPWGYELHWVHKVVCRFMTKNKKAGCWCRVERWLSGKTQLARWSRLNCDRAMGTAPNLANNITSKSKIKKWQPTGQ